MADTTFVKGDIVVCCREKPSVFSYLGARPILKIGDNHIITDIKEEDNLEFYRVGKNVNWYHADYFSLVRRSDHYKNWNEL